MSRVNLFYTGGSFQAAHLHPARTHDGKRETVRGGESNFQSNLTLIISCLIINITSGRENNKNNNWRRTTTQLKILKTETERSHRLSNQHFFALMYRVAPCGSAPSL